MLALGARNGVHVPYADADEARAAYRFADLRAFLHLYYRSTAVLLRERDFFELTAAYLRHAQADGTRHVEIFFDPAEPPRARRAVRRRWSTASPRRSPTASARSASRRGSSCAFCATRARASALEVARAGAGRHRDLIVGVGLDSAEVGHPPGEFAEVFAAARAAGFVDGRPRRRGGPRRLRLGGARRARRAAHRPRRARDRRRRPGRAPARRARHADDVPAVEPARSASSPTSPSTRSSGCSRPACRSRSTPTTPPTSAATWSTTTWPRAPLSTCARDDIVALARNSIAGSLLPAERQAELLAEIDAFVAARALSWPPCAASSAGTLSATQPRARYPARYGRVLVTPSYRTTRSRTCGRSWSSTRSAATSSSAWPRCATAPPSRRYVAALRAEEHLKSSDHSGRVPQTNLWWVEGDEFIGRIALRHALNAGLRSVGGHIGYEIRPSLPAPGPRHGHAGRGPAGGRLHGDRPRAHHLRRGQHHLAPRDRSQRRTLRRPRRRRAALLGADARRRLGGRPHGS